MRGADETGGYRPVAKLLHWLTALLVLGMLGVGLWMVGLPISLTKLYVYAWHKWIGLTILLLTVLRLVWRTYSPPPPLPASATAWERRLAPWAHVALLVLLLAMPVSGWMMSSAGGVSVHWFGMIDLPDLISPDPLAFTILRTMHYWLAWALMAILALHVAAVLHHDLFRRDGIWRRMSPFAR